MPNVDSANSSVPKQALIERIILKFLNGTERIGVYDPFEDLCNSIWWTGSLIELSTAHQFLKYENYLFVNLEYVTRSYI